MNSLRGSLPLNRRDMVWVSILFVGTVLYLALLPRNLGRADESVYLYEARQVLRGEIPYRDFFEIITPGWMVLMATAFGIFGTDMATARVTAAVIHAVTSVLVYLTCRRVGVRAGLSWPPALAVLVICQPAWPIASQHWLGTVLSALLLYVCAGRRSERRRWALWAGVVVGLLIAVHQQRGVIMGAGVCAWLLADALLRRWHESEPVWRTLRRDSLLLGAGVAIVVIPMLAVIVAAAGFDNVWRALVIHPIFNYGGRIRCAWGAINLFTAELGSFTFPRVLTYLPVVVAIDAARLLWLFARPAVIGEMRPLVLLVIFCLVSMASIAYFPDFIHIAFIAPTFFVAVGEVLEWMTRRVPATRGLPRTLGWVAAVALLAASGYRLQANLVRARALYPLPLQTMFGRVDMQRHEEVQLYERLAEVMQTVPGRALFCYPFISHLYLLADADNPTRYQFFQPGYNSPDQIQELVTSLDRASPAYLAVVPLAAVPGDPIMTYIDAHYAPLPETQAWETKIYRRTDDA